VQPRVVLEASDLEVRRGGGFRLQVPGLQIAEGETLAVLGPNGAGKSTLLETLALLRRPDRGEVRVLGSAAAGSAARLVLRRCFGLAMQDPFLLLGSVLDNVALPLRLRGLARPEARRAARPWMRKLGVEHLAERPARALSGGEARRASLARALVTEPALLLLDEPFSALDPPARDAIIRDFQDALGARTAVLLVTHDRYEALAIARRVAVLEAGRLLQIGPTQEVFSRPADAAVAALVGVESILRGVVRKCEEGVCQVEVAPGTVIEAVAGAGIEAAPGAHLTLCVRPEEVTLERAPAQTSARNVFPALIRALSAHGPGVRVELECPFALVAVVTRRSAEELDLRPGGRVSAAFKASAVHVFPARGPSA